MATARQLPCGCHMDPFDHSGGCQQIHLCVVGKHLRLPSMLPLCGMDAYKVNKFVRGSLQTGTFTPVLPAMFNEAIAKNQICLVCLEAATAPQAVSA